MRIVVFIILATIAIFVVPFLSLVLISALDSTKSSWYDDARDSDCISEKKKLINRIDKESNNKRADYLFCVRNVNIVGSDNILNYMRKIDEYLTSYKLEQFDRFYTVYCKELGDILKKIKDCKCSSLYYSLVAETRATYGSIFSKMLADVEAFIKNNSASVTDIEGIKNFAKINGDFDESYKAEEAHKSASDADIALTSTTSAVENRAKNYAEALTRAYEKVSQYKKENAQLTKELEKCRVEAKKHSAKKKNKANTEENRLKSDLERLDEVIRCQERAGGNGARLEVMREVRHEIIEYVTRYGVDRYNDEVLYCWGKSIGEYLNDWEVEFDYTHDYTYYDGWDE